MSRLTSLQKELGSAAALLVSNPVNIRYLTGFTGSNSCLLVAQNSATLFTDPRYDLQATAECHEVEVRISYDIWGEVTKSVKNSDLKVESNHLTLGRFKSLESKLPIVQISATDFKIEQLRIIKDQTEIAAIRTACKVSTAALTHLISTKLIGRTERDIALTLERSMMDLGATAVAFNTIVASGPNSAIPHHQPTNRILQTGDLLKIDFGAEVNGYKSDCTRTFVAGKPAAWQIELHSAVVDAQAQGRTVAKPNQIGSTIDEVVRASLKSKNMEEHFTHGLGHGVGLDIHEDPFLGRKSPDKIESNIQTNMVFTIEPGVYLPDRGGVRIEDTGVLGTTEYEVLTKFPYELIQVQ